LNEIAYQLISAHVVDCGDCEAYLLFAHGRDDSDKEIFTLVESRGDLTANLALWNLNVILRGAIHAHQVK